MFLFENVKTLYCEKMHYFPETKRKNVLKNSIKVFIKFYNDY